MIKIISHTKWDIYLFNFLCFYSIARLIRRTLIHSELPGKHREGDKRKKSHDLIELKKTTRIIFQIKKCISYK
ncbi:hypothetical protein BpHYR1_022803 [Brachionus plicatilis]|uniref:Uncharacterized protein n=1 Tax=Brachionus plicatilis TaxID=10195 RepID=A0A3M7SYB3_BRAPC|nr:hypothetical protein BpHYR1_022803 [Brachionus plicatilis]